MKSINLSNERLYITEILNYLKEKTKKQYEVIKDEQNNLIIVAKELSIQKLTLIVKPLDECLWDFKCLDEDGNDLFDEVAVFLWSFEICQDENNKDYINAMGSVNGTLCINKKLNIGEHLTYEEVYKIIKNRG